MFRATHRQDIVSFGVSEAIFLASPTHVEGNYHLAHCTIEGTVLPIFYRNYQECGVA